MTSIFQTEFRDLQDENGQTSKASTCKLVLLAMADHANDEGEGVYPSIEILAKKCALSEQTIRNTFGALLYNGIIYRVGLSKHGTHNHTIETRSFPQSENKRDFQPLLGGVKPVEGQTGEVGGSNRLDLGVKPVDPNHHLTIKETSTENFPFQTMKSITDSANRKVDSILAMEKNAPAVVWAGRELVRPDMLPLADWYHGATGQIMTKRVQKSWWKALGEWKAEGLTPADLQAAFTHRVKWRGTITDPNELTNDAVGIKAAGSVTPDARPTKKYDYGV
jgi:hypothetical protein